MELKAISVKEKEKMFAHALDTYPEECCGIIQKGKYIKLPNIRPTSKLRQQSFEMIVDPEINYQAVFHSHTNNVFHPSYDDMKNQKQSNKPWILCTTDGMVCSPLIKFPCHMATNILNRKYCFGVHDCVTLARLYYWQVHEYFINDFPRSIKQFEKGNSQFFLKNSIIVEDFIRVTNDDIAIGDLIMFAIRKNNINHLGIYLGDEKFIHHPVNGYSIIEHIGRYKTFIASIFRPKFLEKKVS